MAGIFPNPAALLRLATCALVAAHDEWQAADRRYLSEASMAQLNPTPTGGAVEIPQRAEQELDETKTLLHCQISS